MGQKSDDKMLKLIDAKMNDIIMTETLPNRLMTEFDRFLKVINHSSDNTEKHPGHGIQAPQLDDRQTRHIGGLMRINHTGEVCAQALYNGQALWAKDAQTHAHLRQAAAEEHDHLNWCQVRLDELGESVSKTNIFWYAHSFAIGSIAAFFGDAVSYGFVIETERQVESHLQDHLDDIGAQDPRSAAILKQMQLDEIRHGENARNAGGIELPEPVKLVMTGLSKFMKFVSYRI